MVLPIQPILASTPSIPREQSEEILKYELQLMSAELPDLEKFRDYYDGEQGMVFGTEKFKQDFGDSFADFRSNWCSPVVEAPTDKLRWEGIRIGTTEEEIKANETLSRQIWNVFRDNDFDEQQHDLFEGAMVEGRSYVIAWPDEEKEMGVRLDWNPADLIRVRYADDNPRKIIWACKRWLTPSGDVYITVYTPNAIYKYTEPARAVTFDTRTGMNAQRPEVAPSQSFERREVQGERWPLPNPYGQVPVVELMNKRESELHDVIPLQDGVNYLMLQALTAAGFQGYPQRVFLSGVKEPVGGWSNSPGQAWQLPPDIDPDGNLHMGDIREFKPADLSGMRSLIEMVLQHIAHQTKTPVRLFFQSDRGGRGDAPSGESLLVDDQPLLDKVEDRMDRFGNSGYRLARLITRMSPKIETDTLPLGEMQWRDPRAKYRSALIEEGAKMVEKMGMPLKFVIRHLGFSADELELFEQHLEEQKREQEEQANAEAERQARVAESQSPSGTDQPPPNE